MASSSAVAESATALPDPVAYAEKYELQFHRLLAELAGNQTMSIVTEMLNEIVARAVAAVSRADDVVGSLAVRQRGIRSQERLLELIEAGDGEAAEQHWRCCQGHSSKRIALSEWMKESATVVIANQRNPAAGAE